MNISEKLHIIRQLSGLSQEKMAKRLGVSFVTLNHWINNKTQPRKRAEHKIDELYAEFTGQRRIPESVLEAKKQLIAQKTKDHRHVLSTILTHQDLFDSFLLSLTYNTNSIEGSTLSENETAGILFRNMNYPKKHLIEHLEVKNHQAAFGYLLRSLEKKKSIDERLVLRLHEILLNGIQDDAGLYRRHGVRIVGAHIPTENHLRIEGLMRTLMKDIQTRPKDYLHQISDIHARFEKIHPFSDGNGRIGRLIIHAMAFLNNIPPAIFHQEQKHLYYGALQKAQQKNDTSLLEDFLCDAFLEGFQLMEGVLAKG